MNCKIERMEYWGKNNIEIYEKQKRIIKQIGDISATLLAVVLPFIGSFVYAAGIKIGDDIDNSDSLSGE